MDHFTEWIMVAAIGYLVLYFVIRDAVRSGVTKALDRQKYGKKLY